MCLGWLAGMGFELLGTCPFCQRQKRISIAPLARKYGKNVHYTYVQQLMRCGECQYKPIKLRPIQWDLDLEAEKAFGED